MGFKDENERRKYDREYYRRNTDKRKKVKVQRERRRSISEEIKNIKLTSWCAICKYNICSTSLHFDHIDMENKEFDVSEMVRMWFSIEKIKKEIEKCQVLCANCHWEKTHKDFWY